MLARHPNSPPMEAIAHAWPKPSWGLYAGAPLFVLMAFTPFGVLAAVLAIAALAIAVPTLVLGWTKAAPFAAAGLAALAGCILAAGLVWRLVHAKTKAERKFATNLICLAALGLAGFVVGFWI